MEFTIFLNAFFDVTVKRVTRRWGQTAGGAAFDAHFVVASDLDPTSILDEKGPCAEEPGTRTVVDISQSLQRYARVWHTHRFAYAPESCTRLLEGASRLPGLKSRVVVSVAGKVGHDCWRLKRE